MKFHHVIGDGLGCMVMLSTLQDTYNPNQMIQTNKPMSFVNRLKLIVLKPLLLMYGVLIFLVWKKDQNVIRKGKKIFGEKTVAICEPFDVPTLKKIGTMHMKATENDVFLGLVSVGMREYMRKK